MNKPILYGLSDELTISEMVGGNAVVVIVDSEVFVHPHKTKPKTVNKTNIMNFFIQIQPFKKMSVNPIYNNSFKKASKTEFLDFHT